MPNSVKPTRRKATAHQAVGRKNLSRDRKAKRTTASRAALSPVAQTPRAGSKLAKVIELLNRKEGVGIAELLAATEWLPHTARAALTGLRKRGIAIERFRGDGESSHYRIVRGSKTASA
jgi:hypothetical protein